MKKIDVSKSLIFSRNLKDLKKSLDYLYQYGYFSNSEDFSEFKEGTLDLVEASCVTFRTYGFMHDGHRHCFTFFIPKSKAVFVKEEKKKELRPFKSMKEFFDTTSFKIGDVVRIANYMYEEKSIINGFRVFTEEINRIEIIFGSDSRSLDELFKYFKYYKNGEWLRFGIEE